MRITHRHGRLRLRLYPPENALLRRLLDELDALLTEADADDPARQRLFPAAYQHDEAAEREYRALTESALSDERRERLDGCRADLAAGNDVELADADVAQRWIRVLNDLRLAMGTRLGITEEDDQSPVDAQDPRIVYHWLTAMQDGIVQELMP